MSTENENISDYIPDGGVKLDARAYPIAEPKGSLVAFASVTVNDMIAIRGMRVMKGKNGMFASMPSEKDNKGEYRDVCFPVAKGLRKQINDAVLEAYEAAIEKSPPVASFEERAAAAAKTIKDAPAADKTRQPSRSDDAR